MNKILGIFFVIVALVLYVCALSVGIAWIAFCFGSVVVGVILLFVAPLLLVLPPTYIFSVGHGVMLYGVKLLTHTNDDLLEQKLELIEQKLASFDRDLLKHYNEKFYVNYDDRMQNRELYPDEWKKCQAYRKAYMALIDKRDLTHGKLVLSGRIPYTSSPHGVGGEMLREQVKKTLPSSNRVA